MGDLRTAQAENAERIKQLEQLVRDLWDGFECDRCPMYGDDCWVKAGVIPNPCRMMKRMEELGIEEGK